MNQQYYSCILNTQLINPDMAFDIFIYSIFIFLVSEINMFNNIASSDFITSKGMCSLAQQLLMWCSLYLGCALLFEINIKNSGQCNSFQWYIVVITRNWTLQQGRVGSQFAKIVLVSKWQHTSESLKTMHFENGKQHNKKMHASNILHMEFPAMMKYLD